MCFISAVYQQTLCASSIRTENSSATTVRRRSGWWGEGSYVPSIPLLHRMRLLPLSARSSPLTKVDKDPGAYNGAIGKLPFGRPFNPRFASVNGPPAWTGCSTAKILRYSPIWLVCYLGLGLKRTHKHHPFRGRGELSSKYIS